MKRIPLFIALSILIAALLACGSSSTNTGTTNATSSSSSPTTSKHFAIHDEVTVGKTWKVVINSVATNAGDEFNKPTKGTYLVVNISLTNISSQEQNISSIVNFKMQGSDGTAYTEAITGNLAGVSPAPDGKVEAGGVTKGDFVYDVPTSLQKFTLSFTPDIGSSGQTIWDLSL